MQVEQIARICHQVNKAYCESIGDNSHLDWEDTPDWQKESSMIGVEFHLKNDAGPEASHESWLKQKEEDGWKYGPVKDVTKKEHPCFVPFNQLPREQQAKDFLFRAVVHACARVR